MQKALYAEINIMSFATMLLLAFHLFSFERTQSKRILINVFFSEAVLFLTDTAAVFLEGSAAPPGWSYLADIVYFISAVLCPLEWLRYVQFELGSVKKRSRAWVCAPAAAVAVLALLAPVTGWFFTIGEGSRYCRGPLYPLQPAVSLFYLVLSSAVCLKAGRNALTHDVRRKAGVLGVFVYFPLAAIILDIVTEGLPFVCPVTTLALTFVYISLQRQAVTKDALTGANNRFELQRYMDLMHPDRMRECWIFMIDIDDFKHINDTAGHLAGDEALKRTAAAMTALAGERGFFFARYGGDEFAAVARCRDEREAESLKNELKEVVGRASVPGAPALSVSVGAASCLSCRGWEDCLAGADRALYSDKKKKA